MDNNKRPETMERITNFELANAFIDQQVEALRQQIKDKKVLLALSGGVDSSVAAKILLDEGYEVIGLFMRNWDSLVNNDIEGNPNDINDICPQEQDYNDALAVCNTLGIKLHRVDFIKEYWDYVFTYFLDEKTEAQWS